MNTPKVVALVQLCFLMSAAAADCKSRPDLCIGEQDETSLVQIKSALTRESEPGFSDPKEYEVAEEEEPLRKSEESFLEEHADEDEMRMRWDPDPAVFKKWETYTVTGFRGKSTVYDYKCCCREFKDVVKEVAAEGTPKAGFPYAKFHEGQCQVGPDAARTVPADAWQKYKAQNTRHTVFQWTLGKEVGSTRVPYKICCRAQKGCDIMWGPRQGDWRIPSSNYKILHGFMDVRSCMPTFNKDEGSLVYDENRVMNTQTCPDPDTLKKACDGKVPPHQCAPEESYNTNVGCRTVFKLDCWMKKVLTGFVSTRHTTTVNAKTVSKIANTINEEVGSTFMADATEGYEGAVNSTNVFTGSIEVFGESLIGPVASFMNVLNLIHTICQANSLKEAMHDCGVGAVMFTTVIGIVSALLVLTGVGVPFVLTIGARLVKDIFSKMCKKGVMAVLREYCHQNLLKDWGLAASDADLSASAKAAIEAKPCGVLGFFNGVLGIIKHILKILYLLVKQIIMLVPNLVRAAYNFFTGPSSKSKTQKANLEEFITNECCEEMAVNDGLAEADDSMEKLVPTVEAELVAKNEKADP